jgi:hypothetical protein
MAELKLNAKRSETLDKIKWYIEINSPTCFVLHYYLAWDKERVAFNDRKHLELLLHYIQKKIDEKWYVF